MDEKTNTRLVGKFGHGQRRGLDEAATDNREVAEDVPPDDKDELGLAYCQHRDSSRDSAAYRVRNDGHGPQTRQPTYPRARLGAAQMKAPTPPQSSIRVLTADLMTYMLMVCSPVIYAGVWLQVIEARRVHFLDLGDAV